MAGAIVRGSVWRRAVAGGRRVAQRWGRRRARLEYADSPGRYSPRAVARGARIWRRGRASVVTTIASASLIRMPHVGRARRAPSYAAA